MAKYNSLDDNNPVKQTIEKVRLTFMEALKKNIEKGALYAGAMFLGTLMLYNSGVYAEAASASTLAKTSYSVEMSQSNTVTVKLQLNTSKKVKITKDSGVKSIKSTKQSGKTITVKMNIAKAGTYKLKVSGSGMKTSTAKIKVTVAKADHNITSTVNVAGYSIGLGMSTSQVESALASYGAPVYKGSGCQSYDTECWYYQKNGSETSFMIEFYKGSVERILFSSPKWSNGGLSNETKASTLSMSSKSYRTANGSVTAKQYTESKGKISFTAYLDNAEEWKNVGWYLCELKDTGVTHSGKNSLANQTKDLSFDLSTFDTNSTFQKKYKKITKDSVIAACSKVNLLDLEKGKQNVYLTNMYRAYHGLELAAYSEHSSEYAYVNAKVRSMAKEEFHADFFSGTFSHQALQKTINAERVNEWWGGWQETFSENVGYEGGADAITVLRGTVASTGHLENVLSGNFAMGAAIVDGYDTVETIGAALRDADEIAEAQQRFVEEYDLGIAANEVEAALYRDLWDSFTYNDLYELSYMSKEEWINFSLDKYNLKGLKGIEKYMEFRYAEYTTSLCNHVYDGKRGFNQVYNPWLEQGDLTASQLEEVYLHFCALEYDQEYTQALMNHFGCTAEQVYLEHSDVMAALHKIAGTDDKIIAEVNSIASKYELSVSLTAEMYVRAHTGWSTKLANETRAMFGLAPVYTENRLK